MRSSGTTVSGKIAVGVVAALFAVISIYGIGMVAVLIFLAAGWGGVGPVALSLLLMAGLVAATCVGVWYWRRKVG